VVYALRMRAGNSVEQLAESLIGQRIGGRYVVEKLLGRGGMGIVLGGSHPELDLKVAIKVLLPELAENASLCARFLREARVAAKLESPHLVRVFDIGRLDSGAPYMVMELLSGRDLGDELKDRGALSIAGAIDYFLQALAGIAVAHGQGVVHRDLKPSNLFLCQAGGVRTVKVLDFGISKPHEESDASSPLTATGSLLGTPQYMSPEQIKQSKGVDTRADIWSLGVILYELTTGSLPFAPGEGDGIGAMFGLILHTDPTPPRAARPDLPEGLERVILTCLARDREERFRDVGELAEALGPFASGASLHFIPLVRQIAAGGQRVSSLPPRAGPSRAPTALAESSRERSSEAGESERLAGEAPARVTDAEAAHPPVTQRGRGAVIADANARTPLTHSQWSSDPPAQRRGWSDRRRVVAGVALVATLLLTSTLLVVFREGGDVHRDTPALSTSFGGGVLAAVPSEPRVDAAAVTVGLGPPSSTPAATSSPAPVLSAVVPTTTPRLAPAPPRPKPLLPAPSKGPPTTSATARPFERDRGI